MSDKQLRELERQRASGELADEDQERLIRAYWRNDQEPPHDLLAEGPRWRVLAALVNEWYATPLRPGQGNSLDELRQAEERLGLRLPTAVREWFLLVGRRLGSAFGPFDTRPLALLELTPAQVETGVPLWALDGGSSELACAREEEEDPPAVERERRLGVPISTQLISRAQEGTVDVWSAARLGKLREGTQVAMFTGRERNNLYDGLPRVYPLRAVQRAGSRDRVIGDAETLIRLCVVEGKCESIYAAAKTKAAWTRLDRLVQTLGGWSSTI